ncbi:MAG: hypothetical protein WC729_07690 [Sphingomonas sp.]|jgi:hypothetical protein|uniref:hypothetical protein n=1 Tax=Sphingomonas sp. TaxID=28214 RepID=UPI003562F499
MAGNRHRRLRALLLVPLAVPLMAQLNVLVDEARNVILADGGSVVPGAVVTARKGEVFYRQPLGRSHAAALEADVSFSFLGQAVAIGKDEQLIQSSVSGMAASLIRGGDKLYCTVAKPTGKKRVVGLSEIGAVGMDLDAIAKLRHIRTQSCLIDAGNDGTADKAFVADTSNREPITPVEIQPVPIRKLGIARMPGESEVRMIFDGQVGIIGNLSTHMQVVEEGKPLAFSNGQTLFRGGGALPRTIEAFGALFTILSYDGKTKSAEIRIDRAFAPVEYGVRTEMRYR